MNSCGALRLHDKSNRVRSDAKVRSTQPVALERLLYVAVVGAILITNKGITMINQLLWDLAPQDKSKGLRPEGLEAKLPKHFVRDSCVLFVLLSF